MATYNGTNGDDVINASAGSNTINAGNGNNKVTALSSSNQNVNAGTGNDTITTGDGNDTINAGDGVNVINAGNGTNNVTSGSGNDTITTGTGNDTINAGNGRNVINAGDGRNNVTTGTGDDEVRAGSGDDQISAGEGNNWIDAGNGTNSVSAGAGNDTITTGSGNDNISAGNGNNIVNAGGGNNSISAGSGDDWIRTAAGNDTISAGDGRNDIDAGDGKNTVNTGRGDDTIVTGRGNDQINAGDGRNIIDAGDGDNRVNTGSGADDITTGDGDDQINAGEGVNVISAGDGDNDITSGANSDTITAGSGNDEIHAGEGHNLIDAGNGNNVVTTGAGNDTITTGSGNDAIYAGEGNNVINAGGGNNAVYAGSGNDTITTGSGNDAIYAGEGNNVVNAGDGTNLVYTGSGNDRVIGGSGSDLVYTGEGNDFVDLGGGSDVVYLDGGNDTYRYVMSQHSNTIDVAWGGSGTDTLQLVLTADQARDSRVISDIQRFNTDSDGTGLWGWIFGFQFTAFNLSVRDFENIDVVAPVDAFNDSATVNEDAQVSINVLANDQDLGEANNGQLRVISYDAAGVPGMLTLSNNQFTFVPGAAYQYLAAGQSTTVSFNYTIGDNEGYTDTATVTLTIVGSNDGPVAIADVAAITENQAVTVDVLANDTDVDANHVFTLVSAGAPTGKGLATVVNNKLVFTPGTAFDHLAAGATETVVVTYTMKDDQGATSTATLTVTVTGTNDGPVAVADTAAGTENQILSIDVLANDTDVDDGSVFTLTGATAPAGKGSVAVVNNQLVFTPGAAFDHLAAGVTETVLLSYAMNDQFGAASTATVTVTITGTNDGPVAVADAAATTENAAITVDVLANDAELDDGAVFTLTGAAAPAGRGAATVVDNKLVFTPGADFDHLAAGAVELVTLTYVMTDEHGAASAATVIVTVTGTNDGPVAIADTAAISENAAITVDVLANDTDLDDGHAFMLTAAGAPAGKGAAAVVNNQLVFTPGTDFDHLAAGAVEVVTLTYAMTDENGAASTSTVTVTITGTNDAPVAVADVATAIEDGAVVTGTVAANDSDVDDNATHSFALDAPVAGLTLAANGSYSFDPANAAYQSLAAGEQLAVVAHYTITDDQGATATATLTITLTGTNDAPVVTSTAADSAGTVVEAGEATAGTIATSGLLTSSDIDHGATATWSGTAEGVYGGFSIGSDGHWVYGLYNGRTATNALAAGETATETFVATVTDEHGATATQVVTITITGTNDAPVATADVAAGTENQTLTIDVLANDTDADHGASFTLSSATAPAGKGVASVAGNSLVFAPGSDFDHLAAGAVEIVTLTYVMTDEHGAASTATVTVTITGTNDGPVAVADTGATGENAAITIDVLANDTDVDDGHVFTLTAASAPAGKGVASIAGNSLIFTPGADFEHLALGATEVVTLNYTMRDDQGAESVSTVTVTITGTNDGPVAVADSTTGTENQILTVDVLANDTDLDDGAVFTLTSTTAPAGKGAASIAGNHLVFAPGADFDHLALGATEVVTLSYTMADEHGAVSTATLTVTVTGTNDAPVAVADTAATSENAAITIDVLANDTDVDDGHVFTLVGASSPLGTASVVGNSLVFNPGSDFDHLALDATANVVVTYLMADEHGATSTATVTITVTGTNDAPVAVADSAAGTENQTLTINVLANDSDVDDGHVFTLTAAGAPAGKGLAAVVGNQLVFAPGTDFDHLAAGATEQVVLTYTMRDEHGATSSATVTVTVTGTNDAPVAGFDMAATTENASVAIDVLGNDTDLDDGAVLTVVGAAMTNPSQGSVAVVNNLLVYTPANFDHLAAGATATVTIFYAIMDQNGGQSAAVATVTVTGTNDGPVAVADTAATSENAAITVDVLANDTDLDDGHAFMLTSVAAPAGKGAASVVGNQLVFTPGADFDHLALGATELVTVSYTMRDDQGAESVSTLTVTITGTNDAPVAVADTAATSENAAITVDVLANDTDLDDGHVFTLTSVTAPEGKGSAAIVGNQLVFTPGTDFDYLAAGETQTVVVAYSMRDEQGAESVSTATITVTGTNDAPVLAAPDLTTITFSEAAVMTPDYNYQIGDFQLNGISPFNGGTGLLNERAGGAIARIDGGSFSLASLDIGSMYINNPVTLVITGYVAGNAVASQQVIVDPSSGNVTILLGAGFADVTNVSVDMVDGGRNHDIAVLFDNIVLGDAGERPFLAEQPDLTGSVGEDIGRLVLQFAELDLSDAVHAVVGAPSVSWSGGPDLPAGVTDMLAAAVTATVNGGGGGGNVALAFSSADGNFDFLAAGETLTVTYEVTVTDAAGAQSTQPATFTILGANDGPILVNDEAAVTVADYIAIDVLANDVDPDNGGVLTLVDATVEPGQGYVWIENGQVMFDPGQDFAALAEGEITTVQILYTVLDDHGAAATAAITVTVTGTNDAPVANYDDVTSVENAAALVIDVLANDTDADNGHVLTLVSASVQGGGTVSIVDNKLVFEQGTAFDYLPIDGLGQANITYVVRDEHGAESIGYGSVTISGTNDGPVANPNSFGVTIVDQPVMISVLHDDSDVDSASAMFRLVAVEAPQGKGTASVVNNVVHFDFGHDFDHLAQGETETVTLNYTMTDGDGGVSSSTLTLTVTGRNEAPMAMDDVVQGSENQTLLIDAAANDLDVDSGAVLQANGVLFTDGRGLAYVEDGKVVFNPLNAFDHLADGDVETVTLHYSAIDEHGAQSNSAVITIHVIGTNDAPRVLDPVVIEVSEDAGPAGFNALVGASDADDNAHLQVVVDYAALPEGVTFDAGSNNFVLNSSAMLFQSLAAGETRTVTVQYGISDGIATTPTSASWTITGVNDAPTVTSGSLSHGDVTEAGVFNDGLPEATGTLVASDVDAGATLTWSGNAAGVYGSFAIDAAGAWTYTLDNEAAATQALNLGDVVYETFTATVSDGLGGTATQLVTIQVFGAIDNRAPSAAAVSASGSEDSAVIVGLFAGTDPDAGDTLTYEVLSQPSLGTVLNMGNGSFDFHPGTAFQSLAAGETSVQTFTYRTLDQLGAASAPATVTITITGSNDAPVITSSAATAIGTLIEAGHLDDGTVVDGEATAIGILTASDVDADATQSWSVVNSGNGTYGSLSITSAGVWTYTLLNGLSATQALAEGQTGTETFTVRVSDGQGGTADQVITINVTGTNDVPVLTADVRTATEDGSVVTGSVKTNDVDVDAGAVLTYTLNAPVAGLTLNSDGSYSFNPANGAYQALAAGATQTVIANYTATDEHGASATSTLTITVTGKNDAPIAVADIKAATEDTVVTGSVATNDSDVDNGATLSYSLNAPVAGLTLNSNGSYSFNAGNAAYQHLAQGATQTVTANYTVTDDKGATATSTLTITVTGTNDAPVAVADTSNGGAGTGSSSGGAIAAGDQFIISAPSYGDDQQPSVAKLSGGGFVVTWSLYDYNTGTQSIQAQLFDNAGNKVGGQLTYTPTGYNQVYAYEPQVSALSGGGYVVAWSHYDQNVGRTFVHSQTYNSAGTATGTEAVTDFSNGQGQSYQPAVTALVGGGYAVAMQSNNPYNYSDQDAIGVRVYNSAGQLVASIAQANTATTYGQYEATITALSDGGFVVAWSDQSGHALGDQTYTDVRLQRFDAAGNRVGSETLVNTNTYYQQYQPSISALAGGGFVVTWLDDVYNSSTGSTQDIHGQLFNASGAKVGGEFVVNTVTDQYQGEPTVAGLPGGGFVVAWTDSSNYGVGNYTDGQDVRAQIFDATGAKVGSDFVVTSSPEGDEYQPSISAGADGTFVVTWGSYNSPLGDGTGSTTFGRLFAVGTAGNENSPVTIDVLANDTDVDDGAVLTLTSVAVGAGQGSASIVNNKLVFDPGTAFDHLAAGATQTVTVVYAIQDQYGATSNSVATITLTGVNDAPVAVADTKAATEDTVVTGSVATNDSDVDDGAVLTYALNSPVPGLTLNSNGTYTFNAGDLAYQTIAAGATRAVVANYTVTDQAGATSTATLTINVVGINDAPSGSNNVISVVEDGSVSITTSYFGFSDYEGNALNAVKISTLPSLGTLKLNGVAVTSGQFVSAADIAAGKLVYTPPANANGNGYTSFTFQLQDNGGTANGGTDLEAVAHVMTISVTPVNDAPSGTDATLTVLEDATLTISAANFGFSDTDGNALGAVIISTLPTNGTLRLNGVAVTSSQAVTLAQLNANQLTFTPAANANGTGYSSLTFQVVDNGGTANGGVNTDQSPNTLTINVTPVNDAPAGANATVTTLEDTPYTVGVADFGFSDVDGNGLAAVRITTLPGAGTLRLNGTTVTAGQTVTVADIVAGNLVYTPVANATASTSFTFQVQDDGGTANGGVNLDASPNTLTIAITPVNDAPVGVDRTITALEDTALVVTSANFAFTDTESNALASVKITTLPTAGTLLLNGVAVTAGQMVSAADIAANKLTYLAAANASGTGYANFTFQVQDNGGTANGGVDTDQSPNTMTINVTAVNDAPTDLVLSGNVVPENVPSVTVGLLSATDADTGDTFTYSIRPGLDGALFTIVGNELRVGGSGLDYEQATSRQVTIRVTDASGGFFDRTFIVQIADSNEFTLTNANDTFTAGNTNDQVIANSLTLNAGDQINTGGGADELLLFGNGTFNLSTLAGYAGVETVRLINLTTGTATLSLKAGVQNDVIVTGTGPTAITLNNLASTVTGADGSDTVTAGTGNAVINTGLGADTVTLGSGTAQVDTGTSNDTVTTGTGTATIITGQGADTVNLYGTGSVTVDTGIDNDVINHTVGTGTILTGAGADQVRLGNGLVSVDMGADNDAIAIDQNGWNANQTVDGGSGTDTFIVYGADRNLTTQTLTNLEILNIQGSAISNAAQLAQFTQLTGSTTSKLTIADATFDWTGKSLANIMVYSTNATGTLFKVSSAAAAAQIFGGNGQDTVQVVGATLTADQRDVIFATTSIDTLIDNSGTYQAPPSTPGLTRLTTGNDTVVADPGDSTVNATSITLGSGDVLAGGGGTDTLAIYGSGTFNLNAFNVTGYEEIKLINNSGTAATLYLRTGQASNITATGNTGASVVLNNLASTVTMGAGNDTVQNGSGTATISTGAGGDTVFMNSSGNAVIDTGIGGDNVYMGTGIGTVTTGDDNDQVRFDYYGFNAASTADGGNGFDYIYFSGARDLSGVSFTNFEYFNTASAVRLSVAQIGQLQYLTGNGVASSKITFSESNVDLTGKQVQSVYIASDNATGTSFTVNNLTAALGILGGAGNDTINAPSVTISALDRETIFATTQVDRIIDATGTYLAPAASAGTIRLTTGNDTLPASPDSLIVTATSLTFTNGDNLAGGNTGVDELRLYNGGTFNFNALAGYSGFEQVTLVSNSLLASWSVTLRNGVSTNLVYAGSANVDVFGSDTASSVTLGSGGDRVYVYNGAMTVNTGAGGDVITMSGSGAGTINAGDGNDTLYFGTGVSSIDMGIGSDRLYDVYGFAAGSTLNGGTDSDIDYLVFNNSRDMTTVTVTNFQYLSLETANVTVKMSAAQLAQFGYVYGTTGTKITTDDAVFDLSGKSTGTVSFLSGNASGTLFKVSSSAAGFQVVGGNGHDGVEAVGFNFTVDQRTALLNGASVEYIIEGNTYYGGLGANTLTGTIAANTMYGGGGDDTLDGGAGADVLTGGDGNDVFVFNAGQANGDRVVDFTGNGAGLGDSLRFVGYGAGATFTQIDSIHWQVNYNGGTSHDIITFDNAATFHISDYAFDSGSPQSLMSIQENAAIVSINSVGDVSYVLSDAASAPGVASNQSGGAALDDQIATVSIAQLLADEVSDQTSPDEIGDNAAGSGPVSRADLIGAHVESSSAADTLQGTGGDDVFVFHAGNAAEDHVLDFQGIASQGGDKIEFQGFGEGAIFIQVDEIHWQIDYNAGAQHEVITFENAAPINTQDFAFV